MESFPVGGLIKRVLFSTRLCCGGETGIRTPVRGKPEHDFQSCAFSQLSHLSIQYSIGQRLFYINEGRMSIIPGVYSVISVKYKIIFYVFNLNNRLKTEILGM